MLPTWEQSCHERRNTLTKTLEDDAVQLVGNLWETQRKLCSTRSKVSICQILSWRNVQKTYKFGMLSWTYVNYATSGTYQLAMHHSSALKTCGWEATWHYWPLFFFFLGGHAHGLWKFPGSNLSPNFDYTGPLTCWSHKGTRNWHHWETKWWLFSAGQRWQ